MICDNLTVSNGRLLFAGQDTVELARQYGTPLYLMDEDRIRANCQVYTEAFRRHFGPGARPLYASKANSFQRIYEIMREEGMGIDVVSSGEIYTALRAGYDLGQAYFHSNNKTDEDIRYSMDHGIGYFVADNVEEIKAIEAEAARRGIKQRVLLRLTPGIDPHTYEAIATGKVDSKFGSAIETGQAEEITLFTLRQPHVELAEGERLGGPGGRRGQGRLRPPGHRPARDSHGARTQHRGRRGTDPLHRGHGQGDPRL